MNLVVIKFCLLMLLSVSSARSLKKRQLCNNPFNGKQIRVTGDWTSPTWNPAEPLGLMKFNATKCAYTISVGGFKPYFLYAWKVSYYFN